VPDHSDSFTSADSPLLGQFTVEFCAGNTCREDEYRLRHAVFVEERRWLPDVLASSRLERDQFDDGSAAFLLRNAATGEPAACQRFILPDRLPAGLVTPIEQLTGDRNVNFGSLPRGSWAEVSRSTVAPHYRWGARLATMPAMRAIKHASIALAAAFGRSILFSVSDIRTARLTRRMGFPLHQIGDAFEYHGPRAPFKIDMTEVRESVPLFLRDGLNALVAEARAAVAFASVS
jgi:N-acyl-L-homoserine lactone synthetase